MPDDVVFGWEVEGARFEGKIVIFGVVEALFELLGDGGFLLFVVFGTLSSVYSVFYQLGVFDLWEFLGDFSTRHRKGFEMECNRLCFYNESLGYKQCIIDLV